MHRSRYRVIIDTNTLLRGIVSEASAAARLLTAAENRLIIPLLSKPILDEYRAVLQSPDLQARFPALSPAKIAVTLNRLFYVGEVIREPSARFGYRRDPNDRKFIELAIELSATHIVSSDKDLLSLPKSKGDAGKRFRQRLPNVIVLDAASFMQRYEADLRVD